ncbi:MAG TPA: DUF354 domain-containing protein [Phycisphaerales bacterium]|nr:DUF354 domain-containing protein [Phycisphaerales bacterium]
MNILVDVIHPAHVHFFKNAINIWHQKGYNVAITARQKDVTVELLENYNLDYTILSKAGKGKFGLGFELITRDIRLLDFCRKFKADILTGISGYFIAHVGKLIGKPAIVWDDTEHQKLGHKITWPFATQIHSPDCYSKPAVKKQKLYAGFHELAYLHPKYFTPDKEIVKSAGINPEEKYCLIRMVSWQAHHDVGQCGFENKRMLNFISEISKYARPYLSVEGDCPDELKQYQLKIPVHFIHHIMAFASLCVGEGATMISESAVLGVPAVYINTLKLGYINMLEEYGLVKQTTDTQQALQYCIDWLCDPKTENKCSAEQEKLLADKIDVTQHIVETIEAVKS